MRTRSISGLLATLSLGLAACGSYQPPAVPIAPSAPVPQLPAPQPPITLSGTVLEHTGEGPRPLPNAPLIVSIGFSPYLQVTSDATGRYSISDVPNGAFSNGSISIAPAAGSGYYAPCPNGGVLVRDRPVDVHVVSGTLLSTTGMPASVPLLGPIWVSGKVFESTPQGPLPIAGALVNMGNSDVDLFGVWRGSTTLTDAAGRYLLCPNLPGHGTDTQISIRVRLNGYQPASRPALLGWEYTNIDIELNRD